jgi:hypothetical protein
LFLLGVDEYISPSLTRGLSASRSGKSIACIDAVMVGHTPYDAEALEAGAAAAVC